MEVQDAPTADAMSGRKQVNLVAGPRSSLNLGMGKMVQRTIKGIEKTVRGLVEKSYSWEVKDEDEWEICIFNVGQAGAGFGDQQHQCGGGEE